MRSKRLEATVFDVLYFIFASSNIKGEHRVGTAEAYARILYDDVHVCADKQALRRKPALYLL